MIGGLKAVFLLLLAVLQSSAESSNKIVARAGSCSNGSFTEHREFTEASSRTQEVWTGVYGGKKGFKLSKKVVTTVNSTTTFPHYDNLLEVIQASKKYSLYQSSSLPGFFDVHIPAKDGGGIYFTPTLICNQGILRCSGKPDVTGTFCSALIPGSVQSGTFAFVSQTGVLHHAMSMGYRVGINPSELNAQGNQTNENKATLKRSTIPILLTVVSLAVFLA